VRALRHLPGVGLDVVGAGDLGWLRAVAREAGVEDRVALHGPTDDLVPWLDRAGVVLVPSRFEAFGRITVEAFKRGRPVVGAATAGTAHLLAEGRGRTYEPGDDVALARAAARALESGGDARTLAWAAAEFTLQRTARAFEAAAA
jgi:glycosyltransferase involved in cell wall biosynthesis